jgi:hypothetical protein
VFRLFLIASVLLTCCFTYRRHTSLVAAWVTIALLITNSNKVLLLVILRYTLKANRVSIILFSLAKSFIALTTIYRIISLLIYLLTSLL